MEICMKFSFKHLFLMSLIFTIDNVKADIEEWYKNGIEKYILQAEAIVLYRIESIELVKTIKIHNIYQVNTRTIKTLKGKDPVKPCYTLQFEGEWEQYKKEIGKDRIAILDVANSRGCSFIDNMMGAPGTSEYVKYFESIIATSQNRVNKTSKESKAVPVD